MSNTSTSAAGAAERTRGFAAEAPPLLAVDACLVQLQFGQYPSEMLEAATSGWSNAPDRHAQLLGDRLVGEVVIAHQHTEEALTTRRQPFGGHSYRMCLLLPEQGGVERVSLVVRQEVHRVGRRDRSVTRGDPQALAPRGGREPCADSLRLLNAIQVLH